MSKQAKMILLVEDNDLVRWVVEETLREAGFDVVSTSTAVAARQAFAAEPDAFLAVITDVRLSGRLDGCKFAEQLHELNSTTPVLYLTGVGRKDLQQRGVPESSILAKPFTGDQLVLSLTNAVELLAGL